MLTQEQKQSRIAEACGYQKSPLGGIWYGLGGEDLSEPILAGFHQGSVKPLPDYFNDYNAVQDALKEKSKDQGFSLKFESHLNDAGIVFLWRAECVELAECLGLTLGLWKAGE